MRTDKRTIITLPDGYNGHTMDFYLPPVNIEDCGRMKLQAVNEPYMARYVFPYYLRELFDPSYSLS